MVSLTDSQWEVIKDILDNGRKRKNCLQTVLNAIFQLNRTGCPLPCTFRRQRSMAFGQITFIDIILSRIQN
ncbi:MAG TPA: transposase [Bacteroidetes bacterium]|nr:transposase [Bacteroidota bacterium]